MNSYVLRKSTSGFSNVPLDAYLLSNRKILIKDKITGELACDVIGKILFLCMEDGDKPIDILINSPGGEVIAGMTIYDCIQSCKTPIRIINIGIAYSIAAVLLSCGKHGRYLLPHAQVMIHQPYVENCVGGTSLALTQFSERLSDTHREINETLAKHTGKTVEEIAQATGFDNFMKAKTAIEFGICDGIIGVDEILEVAYENR